MTFLAVPAGYNPVRSLSRSEDAFLEKIQKSVAEANYTQAFQFLLVSMLDAGNPEAIWNKIYDHLGTIFPHLSPEQMKNLLADRLQNLLNNSPTLREKQGLLASQLAAWYAAQIDQAIDPFPFYLEAMNYHTKAVAICESAETWSAADRFFMRVVRTQFDGNAYTDALDRSRRMGQQGLEQFRHHLDRIEHLKLLCSCESDKKWIAQLYNCAIEVLNAVPAASLPLYTGFASQIKARMGASFPLATKPFIQKTGEALRAFRKSFDPPPTQNIRAFQREVATRFRDFFQQNLLNITFMIVGPPPCGYDIRAMGSMGREEMSPFSDIEYFILVEKEDEKCQNYFKLFAQFLEFQVLALGETASASLAFTCLGQKNSSGFHIDTGGNPAQNRTLISKPETLAQIQTSQDRADPRSLEHTVLKSLSLSTNCPALFETYQMLLSNVLNTPFEGEIPLRQVRARQLFQKRFSDYRECWSRPFHEQTIDLKQTYLEPLFHLLGDLALYFGVESTNTFEIVEGLTKHGFFSPQSTLLVQEAVAGIYALRVRLHLYYGQQKEKCRFQPKDREERKEEIRLDEVTLTSAEERLLEKAYWLVIRPLYQVVENFCPPQQPLELVEVVFQASCDRFVGGKRHDLESITPLVATALCELHAPFEQHLLIYKKLSGLSCKKDYLRKRYLAILEKRHPDFSKALQSIPNVTGVSISYERDQQMLHGAIGSLLHTEMERDARGIGVRVVTVEDQGHLDKVIIHQLIQDTGNLRKFDASSAHNVCFHRVGRPSLPDLHFKETSTQPLMEYAIHSLTSRLGGTLTPTVELVRFEVDLKGKKNIYPVLVSETIFGNTLKEPLSWDECDKAQWTRFFLSSVLTRPGDGRPSNYILDDRLSIFCIDNDISFAEPLVKMGSNSTIHFCSAPFAVFPEAQLDPATLEAFCQLSAPEILFDWIDEIIEKEKQWVHLFEQEREALLKRDCRINILFREGTLAHLDTQFVLLQNYLRPLLQQKKPITVHNLLEQMVGLSTTRVTFAPVGKYISEKYLQSMRMGSLDQRLSWITSRDIRSSMTVLSSNIACLGKQPTFSEVQKRDFYSPEQAKLELVHAFLKHNSDHFIYKELPSGNFLQINLSAVASLSRQQFILEGALSAIKIKKPRSLTLQSCHTLDEASLKTLLTIDTEWNLEYLHIEDCPAIDSIKVVQEACSKLKELYLKSLHRLHAIETKGFFSTPLPFKRLTTLQVENCPHLREVNIFAPLLTHLLLTKNPQLEKITLGSFACKMETADCPRIKHKRLLEGAECLPFSLQNWRDDAVVMLAAVKISGRALRDVYPPFTQVREIVLAAVTQDGSALEYAHPDLKREKEIVLAALQHDGSAFEYAHPDLKKDKNVVLAAVQRHGWALQHAHPDLQDDEDVVLAAIGQKGSAFAFASSRLKGIKKIVSYAIRQYGGAIRHASVDLQKDPEIALAAIAQDPDVLHQLHPELWRDAAFVLACTKLHGNALRHAHPNLQKDLGFVFTVVSQNPSALPYVSPDLWKDKLFVLSLVKQIGTALRHAHPDLRKDPDVVLAAVTQDRAALEFAAPELQKNPAIMNAVRASRG